MHIKFYSLFFLVDLKINFKTLSVIESLTKNNILCILRHLNMSGREESEHQKDEL